MVPLVVKTVDVSAALAAAAAVLAAAAAPVACGSRKAPASSWAAMEPYQQAASTQRRLPGPAAVPAARVCIDYRRLHSPVPR